jgi:hypothetical protein
MISPIELEVGQTDKTVFINIIPLTNNLEVAALICSSIIALIFLFVGLIVFWIAIASFVRKVSGNELRQINKDIDGIQFDDLVRAHQDNDPNSRPKIGKMLYVIKETLMKRGVGFEYLEKVEEMVVKQNIRNADIPEFIERVKQIVKEEMRDATRVGLSEFGSIAGGGLLLVLGLAATSVTGGAWRNLLQL